jgi:hypothetical protein
MRLDEPRQRIFNLSKLSNLGYTKIASFVVNNPDMTPKSQFWIRNLRHRIWQYHIIYGTTTKED